MPVSRLYTAAGMFSPSVQSMLLCLRITLYVPAATPSGIVQLMPVEEGTAVSSVRVLAASAVSRKMREAEVNPLPAISSGLFSLIAAGSTTLDTGFCAVSRRTCPSSQLPFCFTTTVYTPAVRVDGTVHSIPAAVTVWSSAAVSVPEALRRKSCAEASNPLPVTV